jgi:hypothetical protein
VTDLPNLRKKLCERARRVTNIDPLPAATMDKLYREREDDENSIQQFIAAQPRSAE